MGWTPQKLPALNGKTYAITGGNSGLGLEATKILTAKGARVVFTSRSEDKAKAAIDVVKQAVPSADVDFVPLDLADKESTLKAADALMEKCPQMDAIVNNAGVMQPPYRETSEGYELQIGTNHFGHFRLNARLFAHLEKSGGRIVPVASIAHKLGKISLDDLENPANYDAPAVYAQSKLANLMYGFELHRRLTERKSSVVSIPCHPGYAATNLQSAGVGMDGGSGFWKFAYKITNAVLAQSAVAGAYPLVLAAADPDAKPGVYYGPTGVMQMRGPVGESFVAEQAKDEAMQKALWEKTEALVGPFFG